MLGRHTLFGGRETALAQLENLVSSHSSGYLLVTARSGFGKTALLANWIKAFPSTDQSVCYHFISRLDGTADEEITLLNMCQQLAAFHELGGQLPSSTVELRSLYRALLTTPPPDGRRLIVVLDGLDEALEWTSDPGPDLFPQPLPDGVFVVLSAREMADVDWLAKLELDRKVITTVRLTTLGTREITNLLNGAGGQAVRYAQSSAFVETLHEISEGDPFYLHFLVEDVQQGAITERNINEQPANLNGYLEKWWEQLDQDVDVTRQEVNDLLGLLTVARGPLRVTELADITPTLRRGMLLKRELSGKLRRYLIGGPKDGYALCHPRFRDYLQKVFLPDEQEAFLNQLLRYCERWREHKSPYALSYYALHLFELGQADKLYSLINKDWLDAQFVQTGSHSAFANDLNLAIKLNATQINPPNIAQEARLRLIMAVLGSVSVNTSPELLGAIARLGDTRRALEYAALIRDSYVRTKALCNIAIALARLGKRQEANELYDRALSEQTTDFRSSWYQRSEIVKSLVLSEERTRAIEVAYDILAEHGTNALNDWALGRFAVDLARVGLGKVAIDCIETAVSDRDQHDTVIAVIATLLECGYAAEALDAFDTMPYLEQDPFHAIPLLAGIVDTLVQHDHLSGRPVELARRCVSLVGTVPDSAIYRGASLAQAALAVGRAGDGAYADSLALEAFTWAQTAASREGAPSALAATARGLALAGYLDLAKAITEKMSLLTAEEQSILQARLDAICEIARATARIGNSYEAVHLVREALALPRQTPPGGLVSYSELVEFIKETPVIDPLGTFLGDVARVLADRTSFDEALQVGNLIEDPKRREATLTVIGEMLVSKGKIDRAQRIVPSLRQPELVTRLLAQVALHMSAQGEHELAEETVRDATQRAQALHKDYNWDSLYESLTTALAECGDIEPAMDAVKAIDSPLYSARAMAKVAASLIRAGDRLRALELANRAITLAENFDEEHSPLSPLSQLSTIFADAGVEDLAEELERRTGISTKDSTSKANREVVITFSELADALVKAGRSELAKVLTTLNGSGQSRHSRLPDDAAATIVGEATAALRASGVYPMQISELLLPLFPLLDGCSHNGDAEALADELIAVIEEVGDTYPRDMALSDLAYKLAEVGCGDYVIKVIGRMTGPKPYAAARVLAGCVVLSARHGHAAQVPPLSQAALRLASKFPLAEYVSNLESVAGGLGIAHRCDDVRAIYQYVREIEGWWGLTA